MYARTVPGPEKQPQLRDFLDEPDTPLDIRVAPRGPIGLDQPSSHCALRVHIMFQVSCLGKLSNSVHQCSGVGWISRHAGFSWGRL